MKYAYYPGCSLEKNAAAYHESTLEVAGRLGLDLQEIDDWNCCGATEYVAIDLLPAYALVSRNLALAQEQFGGGTQIVAPCSACFMNLRKTAYQLAGSETLEHQVNDALAAGGLRYEPGDTLVRHLLEVLVEDVGCEALAERVEKPLYGLRLAPYYGCLAVRPQLDRPLDDPEYPMSLDRLLKALSAEVVDYPLKASCCGGHMTQISEETALEMIGRLLRNADEHDAHAIVTVCPMCQLNLDAYQNAVNRHFGTRFDIPILYVTQVVGLALGADPESLGIGRGIVDADPALAQIQDEPARPVRRAPTKTPSRPPGAKPAEVTP